MVNVKLLLMAAPLAAGLALAPAAYAGPHDFHGHGGGRGGWHGGGRGGWHGGGYGGGAAAAVLGGLVGLGIGAAIASSPAYAAPPVAYPPYYGAPGYAYGYPPPY